MSSFSATSATGIHLLRKNYTCGITATHLDGQTTTVFAKSYTGYLWEEDQLVTDRFSSDWYAFATTNRNLTEEIKSNASEFTRECRCQSILGTAIFGLSRELS